MTRASLTVAAAVLATLCVDPATCAPTRADDRPPSSAEFVTGSPRSEPLLEGLRIESAAAKFGHTDSEQPLYVVASPQFAPAQPDWVRPQHLLSTNAFEEVPHAALATPVAEPSSLWERWRQQRILRRRRPASWFRYPFYFEKFTSLIRTDEPIHDKIHDGRGNLFGGRLGWDFAPMWGVESRFGYLRSVMTDAVHPLLPPHENFFFCDTSMLLYLRGDVRWRPFVQLGVGLVNVGFIDDQGVLWNQTLMTMPFGAGFKYRVTEHNAMRFEVLDNLVYGNGHGGNRRAMNDVAVSFAFERRFGLPHKSYFPHADGGRWTRWHEWLESMSH